jgi:DNA-binding PadR family transcriptional regulator
VLELAILGLLHDQELHGYEIRRRLRDELGLFANISFGSLYPALSRLEKAGAVAVTESSDLPAAVPMPFTGSLGGERAGLRARRAGSTRGTKRSRKVYRITDQGRLLFEQLLAPQARLALLERRRSQLSRRLDSDRVRAAGQGLDDYARSLVEHGTEATEHDIAWLDRLIEAERHKQTPSRSETSDPRDGDAIPATKGTNQ